MYERDIICKVIVPMQENMSTEPAMTLEFEQKPQNQIGFDINVDTSIVVFKSIPSDTKVN